MAATEIFQLLGKIGLDGVEEAKKGIDGVNDKAGTLGTVFNKAGKVAAGIGKAVAVGVGAAATAVGAITKASVDGYAEYEQLVGGVKTLFNETELSLEDYAISVGKTTQEVFAEWSTLTAGARWVTNNAQQAYITAGLSANEYMETVTSFSASLIQGLGGDTVEAAQIADMAITDMADNANKMGTDIASIQNAYQGFAKQNFTMLDNLKLGYGGTKTEMERLLRDAEKYAGLVEGSFSIDNFADISKAINIVQTEMGIYGATAAEAMTTIQGSANATKAAWKNLVVAFATDEYELEETVSNFVDSAVLMIGNIAERVQEILPRLVEGLNLLITELTPFLTEFIGTMLPGLIEGATTLFVGLVEALPTILQILIEQLPFILTSIGTALIEAFPVLLETVKMLFGQIWEYVCEELLGIETDFDETFAVVEDLFNSVWESCQYIWDEIGKPIFDAMSEIFGKAKEALQPFIDKIVEYVTEGELANDITETVKAAVDFLVDAYEEVVGFIDSVVTGFQNAVAWGKEHETALALIAVAVGTLTAAIVAYNIAQGIKNAGGIVELAQLAATAIGVGALTVAETAHTVATTIATAATTAFGAAVAFLTSPVTLVIAAIGALIAIIVVCIKHWDDIKEAAAKAWEWIKETWDKVATWFDENVIQPVVGFFTNLWDSIMSAGEGAVNFIKETWESITTWFEEKIIQPVVEKFESIKTTISDIFEGAKEIVQNAIEKIKGFFDFDWELPKLKMPHFSIDGEFSLSPLSVPKFSISWYKKAYDEAMVLNDPTIFGYSADSGKLLGGGEGNGNEVVAGESHLMEMIRSAVATQNETLVYYLQTLIEMLADYFPQILDNMERELVLDSGELVGTLAVPMNERLGRIMLRKDRGR